MGKVNLRSLLVAAIFLSNCISWTQSKHHFRHNVYNHRTRHRRQGAGLFLPASYVIPGGDGSGAWGEWGDVSPCSRTCGGGVASQKRICLEVGSDGRSLCSGGDTKYFSCQTHDCPEGGEDFRSEQCAKYDTQLFKGHSYNWVPYTRAPNPCELNCMPRGERFYYRHELQVVDGTRCNDESFDVCVAGICQPVGCDMMLGSNAKEDKCRQCRGNGTNCYTSTGIIDSQDFRKGYNDVLLIPQGATNIVISEVRSSNNYLALRAQQDNLYYLNGDYHIDFPRSLTIAGSLWYYERSQQGFAAPDKLRSLGPTSEALYLSLLLQEDNVGISYEYSIPSAQAPPPNQQYNWVHEEFSPCNASCGGGIQLRQVSCRSREELEVVEDSLCDKGLKPPTTETCNTGPCPPHWVEGPWSPCTKACGEGGSRSRQVHCEKVIAQGVASIATDKECFDLLGPKPKLYEECNQNASCPTWFTGPWRPCDKLCGEGKQLRQAVCHQRINGRVVVYADEQCTSKKPPTEQSCMLHPCEGVDWVLSDWTGCNTCTSKVRTRTAHCSTKDFQIVKSSFCDYHPMPVLEEPCDPNTLPACELLWYATQWSSCSAECGKGIQTRRVFCGRFDGAGVTVVDDERCDLSAKYNDTKECEVPKEKCPAKWFTGPWTECTKMCGGGEQYRRVKCMRGDKIYSSCDPDVPDSLQTCNLQSCNEDELIPENASSTSIVDDDSDYTDCEEDDYPEEGAEEDALEDLSSEGLHFTLVPENAFEFGYKEGSTEDTDWIDNDKDYTTESTAGTEETGSGSDELFISLSTTDSTDSTTAGTTEYTESVTSIANETVSTESSDTSGETEESATTEDEPESTTELPSGGTDSESRTYGSTDASKITEDSITSESTSETADSTDSTVSESVSTESTDSSMLESASTESTDSSVSESASTESTDSSVSESANTESTDSSVSESASTVSADSSVPESASTLSTDLSVSESASTESTDSSVSEFSSTESTDSSVSESASTESTDSSVSESASTLSTDSSVSELSSIESTDSSVSESASTESTDSTVFESVGSTESSATETIDVTTGSVATESSSDITETTDDTVTKSTFGSTESTTTDATLESETTHSTETNEVSSTESSTTEFTTESKTTEGFSTNAETETMSETETTEIDFSSITTEATEESDSTVLSSKVTDISDTTIGAETTETGTTESLLTDNGSTESGLSTTDATSESVSTSVTDETTPSSGDTTLWDWSTTVELYARPKCRSRKTAKCIKSKFGCCSDKKTPAAGPFDEGCPNPKTCKETKFGCCPDGVSPSGSLKGKGCPEISCNLTLYGCCTSDNVTTAGGNDQEGCPLPSPACKLSEFGCCNDNETQASGLNQEGCPETATSTPSTSSTSETCNDTEFGCCYDNETDASGPNGAGCPCSISEFGCCPDGISTAQGPDLDGCVMCKTSAYGCCPDDETPAHGPQNEGCCLQSAFGCCPDNYKAAEGPHLEGCDCTYSHYGCCPDNITFARGPNNDGCGCQYTQNGCCADRHTPASGPDFEGCSCHTYQFGCCPDGITASSGPNMEGCLCQTSKYGCCGDDVTGAKGPNKEGCDCSNSKFGCCPDGVTEAAGEKFKNCTDVPENRQAACALATDQGVGYNYSVYWFYDMTYGGCSRFWYKGEDGNGNRFASKEECTAICVSPPAKDVCNLPKVKGACDGSYVKWYYDSVREQCGQFMYGGCLGNDNNFESRELCQKSCEPEKTEDQCNAPIEHGSCAGNFLRWGYNSATQRCSQFIWGGCEGNANRFGSEAACMQRCNPPGALQAECIQPQEIGNCTEKQPVWSFSQTENRCVPFYYTGCGGNDNRFVNEKGCSDNCPSAYVQEICTLPALTGECSEYKLRWFYDTSKRRCRQFYYGGCGGNENNFASERLCEDRCSEQVVVTIAPIATSQSSEFCFLGLDPGPCTRFENRWGYDSSLGDCVQFQYGGCGGNRDNFPSKELCQQYCPPVQDTCQLPMITGPCDGSEMQWFYDTTTATCTQFAYSGCEGNDNRFATREECEHRCKTGSPSIRTTTIATMVVTIECRVSPTLEECEGAGQVWYFDDTLRSCVSHQNVDSGRSCRVTGVFVSQEECERICGAFQGVDVCNSALDPGPCYDAIPKVFYNATSDQCEPFTYSGCLGGPNRFTDYDECESHCRRLTNPCKQEPNPGNCLGEFTKWYYSENEDKCREFVYGGCEGNNNRFDSQAECENRCVVKDATTAVPTLMSRAFSAECHTPVSLQPCGPNVTTYYYDSRTKACIVGDFGACGYANSYRSEEECERRCGAFKQPGGCDTYDAECEALQCRYGVERKVEHNNCTRCRCLDHPCANKVCPSGERCAITSSYRELQTQNILYSVDCRLANKAGSCPTTKNSLKTETCRRECNDDADCATDHKCCEHGCSNLCLPPVSELPNTTAYTPESQLRPEPPVPNINQTEPEVRATEGGKATLRCLFHGNPPPKITWRRGELTISGDIGRYHLKSDGALEIVSLYRNDSGVYICIAQNNLGSATQEVYLQVEDSNEILPPTTDCGDLLEECETLRRQCPYDLLHTYVGQDCVRCSCPQPDPNRCDPFMLECQALICQYGVQSTQANDGCTRCHCNPSPCEGQQCAAGEKCQVIRYRDSITHEIEHFSECREINKIGICPITNSREDCRDECQDDSDCTGVGKCCATGCSHRCIIPEPIPKTSPAPLPTSYLSGIPRAPEVSTDTEQDQRASEDGKATLRCLFHSNPPSKITWRRGEITIDRDIGRYRLHADGTLEIVSVYRNDTGVYICIARNSLGTARNEIRLQVDDPVNGPAGIGNVPNEIIYGNIGEPLDIRCLVFGHPQPSIYWYKGKSGPMIPYSSTLYEARGDVLQIHQLNAETLGEYICLAYNGLEKPAEWAFSVQELIAKPIGNNINTLPPLSSHVSQTEPTTSTQPPYVKVPVYTVPVTTTILAEATQVSAGTVLTVPCEVDGYPVPVVRWSKDNVPLESSDRIQITEARLTISHANTNDSGEYACEASNGYSSHSSTVRIIVEGTYIPPTCKDSPYFANCLLIVRSNYCHHRYYSRFCCKSCLEAGQLDPAELELMQADETYKKK